MCPTPRKTDAMHFLQSTKSQAAPEYIVEPGRPKFPKGLSTSARKTFKRICALLEQRRVLTEGDAEMLRLYAVAFDRHAKAMDMIATEGEIKVYYRLNNRGESVPSERPNLWLRVAQDSEKFMVSVLDRLGLSPLNKSKVKPTKVPDIPSVDPMAELLSRRHDEPSSAPDVSDLPDDEELTLQ